LDGGGLGWGWIIRTQPPSPSSPPTREGRDFGELIFKKVRRKFSNLTMQEPKYQSPITKLFRFQISDFRFLNLSGTGFRFFNLLSAICHQVIEV